MATIKLWSHDRWYEIANYDTVTRVVVEVYRPEVDPAEVPTSGNFGTLGTERLIVRACGPDRIIIGFERGPEIPFGEAHISWVRGANGQTEFVLSYGDYRHEVRYMVPGIEDDWDWYGAQLEDFDFGLWALNMQNSPERQEILLRRSRSC